LNRLVCILVLASACIPEPPAPDAGVTVDVGQPDAAVDAGEPEAGVIDTGPAPDSGPVEPPCDRNTVIFGPDCPEEGCAYGDTCGQTGCGQYLCSTEGTLECFFDEANICGGCDELDDSAGQPGETCGAHGCGTVICNADATATICPDDNPRNVCGGCAARITANAKQCLDDSDCVNPNQPCANDGDCSEGHTCTPGGFCRAVCMQDENNPFSGRFCSPGGPCSSGLDQCGTGETRCGRDGERMVCFRGRSTTSCGDCERCVVWRAEMDQRFAGSYILNGTVAVIENVRATPARHLLVFDPLRLGEGADALPQTSVYILNSQDQGYPLGTFARASAGRPPDYADSWGVPTIDFEGEPWRVVLHDAYLGIISEGLLTPVESP